MVGHGGKRLDFVFPRCSCIRSSRQPPGCLWRAVWLWWLVS